MSAPRRAHCATTTASSIPATWWSGAATVIYFVGRSGGIINIGGLKVHPEEVEAVINRHPQVRMSLVRSKRSPLTGAIVIADVVLKSECRRAEDEAGVKDEILTLCRDALPRHKVPAAISIVPVLAVAATGKLARRA